jgi:PEP-CTERM/exosortase A-associated glycosyltransferase
MSLRILHVLDHSVPLQSGYTFRTLEILKEQRKLGWDTVQLTSSKHYGANADTEEFDGFTFHRTRAPRQGWRVQPLLNQGAVVHDTARRLAEVVLDTRPDVIHAHSPCLNGIAAVRVGSALGLPVVYEMRASWEDAAVDHGTTTEGSLRYRLSRMLETWTLRRADAVTTICEGLRSDILARGIEPEKVTVIPNAVDPEAFDILGHSDDQLRAELGLDGAFTLGFLGSFYAYEGLDTLIEAFPKILRAEPRARLLLVGGGYEEQHLKQRAEGLGAAADRIIFAGRVPHEQVSRYYSVVDLLVYPRKSIRLTERVTPLKPLEAMAQGRLLIASNVGGHRELIDDGKTGYLFEPDDPRALAAAVGRVVNDRQNWPSIMAAGRAFVETDRNWRTSVKRYEDVYLRLAERHWHGSA